MGGQVNRQIEALIDRIRELEDELEEALAKRREELSFTIQNRRIIFEQEILERHRELKLRLSRYILKARPLTLITVPFIYSLILPLLLLDLFVTVYQAVCFPIYGIPKVRRSDHFTYDRAQLAYLNLLEKFHCIYCGYGNGLCAYAREIAARTELYWCPIKHAQRVVEAHRYYADFVDFGDGEAYRSELKRLRASLKELGERKKGQG